MVNVPNTHGMVFLCYVFYHGMSFHFHPNTLTGKEIGKDVLKRREG
jgi:hypothetical protein